jgi:hypothetical protein
MLLVGACAGAVLVATCTTKRGGMVRDAAAAPVMSASCNQMQVQVATSSTGTQTTTSYYAEVDASGLDPMTAPTVNAVACDFQYFGSSTDGLATPACPAGATCTNSGYTPPAAAVPCVAAAYARIGAGKIVIYCGAKTQVSYTSTPADNYTIGSAAGTVYVSVSS